MSVVCPSLSAYHCRGDGCGHLAEARLTWREPSGCHHVVAERGSSEATCMLGARTEPLSDGFLPNRALLFSEA